MCSKVALTIDTYLDGGWQYEDTVDGWNPAPVDMVNIPLFTGFYIYQVVQDFFHQYGSNFMLPHFWNIEGWKQNCLLVPGFFFQMQGSGRILMVQESSKISSFDVELPNFFGGKQNPWLFQRCGFEAGKKHHKELISFGVPLRKSLGKHP